MLLGREGKRSGSHLPGLPTWCFIHPGRARRGNLGLQQLSLHFSPESNTGGRRGLLLPSSARPPEWQARGGRLQGDHIE